MRVFIHRCEMFVHAKKWRLAVHRRADDGLTFTEFYHARRFTLPFGYRAFLMEPAGK